MKRRGMWMGFLVFSLVCLLAIPALLNGCDQGYDQARIDPGQNRARGSLGSANGNGMVDYLQYLNDTAGA